MHPATRCTSRASSTPPRAWRHAAARAGIVVTYRSQPSFNPPAAAGRIPRPLDGHATHRRRLYP
ncbi:hypothetical protein CBM2599_B140057 [Cupriavidus taiwanensis]|nr:hypothetical protein CBM2599_B140057 [Cupriavidus taiwanensis]SOY99581.1 hypothetical protein CBM2600_B60305 [Cupriavidus taiwanensis]